MNYVSCFGLTLSVIALLCLGISGSGYRLGLWGFKTGITLMKYAGYISVPALVVCLAGLALWQAQVFPQGMLPALVGSRVGESDVGTNARRIKAYLTRMN